MKMTVLGSGSWEGIPALGCNCATCQRATLSPDSKDRRTRPGLHIQSSSEKSGIFLECSPDFRNQSRLVDDLPDTFFISHSHFDHIAGLAELDAYADLILGRRIQVFGPPLAIQQLRKTYSYLPIDFHELKTLTPMTIKGLQVTAVPVNHYFISDHSKTPTNQAYAYVIQEGDKRIVYMGDFYEVPTTHRLTVSNADILISDGTYLLEDHYRTAYAQAVLSEKDPDHLHDTAITDFATSLKAKSVIYHSVSHLPNLSHEAINALLPARQHASHDGMTMELYDEQP